jgi:1,4-dihydroxy-2-naphthoyl-CoA hydrolase
MPFIAKNKVRMHDTDMAGILYFARQFRFVHDTFEDFLAAEGLDINRMFREEKFIFVIVHVEADYYDSLRLGDEIEVHLGVARIGTTSFTLEYKMFRGDHLTGSAKTVHVCIDKETRAKASIPQSFLPSLEQYLIRE